jgi:DNA replication and repair protein RecF
VLIRKLWLTDYRSYPAADVVFADGLTAIVGANGEGKTNLLEAVGYLATLSSFRGAPLDAMVRDGAPSATVRAEAEREQRQLLIEAEIVPRGRGRIQVNRQRLTRSRDLLGALRVSVFSPDDLELVKGGPAERRRYLDDALVAVQPRLDALRTELDRVLRQRNALLRQAGGRLTPEVASTLAVWDAKLIESGEQLAAERQSLLELLRPRLDQAYRRLARREAPIEVTYSSTWVAQGMAAALEAAQKDELRRGVSLVGPHRDDIDLRIAGLPARTHASQGEQRSLALALRLAAHELVAAEVGSAPVLLLDDVFSELDPDRSHALLTHLPPGQTLLTTAGGLPPEAVPQAVVHIDGGQVRQG